MIKVRMQMASANILGALLLLSLGCGGYSRIAAAAEDDLVLAIQPILDEEQTRKVFQPLCDYLAKAAGRNCRIFTSPNFYAYWENVRRSKDFNLVLDAAHFTDFRAQKMGFEVIAKIPDTVTYSLITRDSNTILDVSELIGKRVATLGIPSIGAARLNSLFPNPSRQPAIIEVESSEAGMKLLLSNKVSAAILPTPFVSQQMGTGAAVSVVLTTDPIPHIALSTSPSISAGTRAALSKALLNATNREDGRKMLKQIGFERFDPATSVIYAGQGKILKEYWGY